MIALCMAAMTILLLPRTIRTLRIATSFDPPPSEAVDWPQSPVDASLRTDNTSARKHNRSRSLFWPSNSSANRPNTKATNATMAAVRSLKVLVEDHHDQYSRTDGHSLLLHKPSMRVTPKEMRESIACMLRQWHALAVRHGVRYWLQAATLLGQVCNGGILPGDDDADIALTGEEWARMKTMLSVGGVMVDDADWPAHMQLIVRTGLHSDIIAAKFVDVRNGVYIDLSLFHRSPDTGLLVHTKAWAWAGSPKTIAMSESELFPLCSCRFESFTLSCPHEPMRMLKQLYKTPFTNCAHQPQDDARCNSTVHVAMR